MCPPKVRYTLANVASSLKDRPRTQVAERERGYSHPTAPVPPRASGRPWLTMGPRLAGPPMS